MRPAKPILLLIAACCCLASMAQVYRADSVTGFHDLSAATTVLVDSFNKLPEASVLNGSLDHQFRPAQKNQMLGDGVTCWVRINITSNTGVKNWWLLLTSNVDEKYYAKHRYVDAWQFSDGKPGLVYLGKSGVYVPRSQKSVKEIPGINRVLFSMAAGDTQKIYVRVKNVFIDGLSVPGVELRNPAIAIPLHESTVQLTAVATAMLMISILSFFFFFFVRDKAYLFFTCYVLFLFLHYQILKPEMPIIDWIIPEHPYLVAYLWNALTMGSFIFFFLFGRSFISLNRLSKKTDRLMKYFIATWTFFTVLNMVLMAIAGSSIIFPYVFFALFAIALVFLVRIAFFKNVLARIFVAGACWLIVFSILGGLWSQRLIDPPFNPWLMAQYGEVLIYCFGLAYKLRLNEQARAEADHIKELDEIKSRFFANISHEFRTPLTLIRGPLQQIEEEATKNNKNGDVTVNVQSRKIQTMRRHTDRLLELVNQLLDLSRLDSGKMKLQVAKGDVIQVLKTLAGSFESMAERKQIHYRVHFPDQSPLCYFDRDKLEKIVTNLLGNAFKYTPERGTVSLIAEIDERRLRLSVEDSGAGIGKKELDKVFDRFYQAEGNEDKGSGIGLALVKELADLYRGQISVSSEPGKGSRFRVSLPIDHASFKQEELLYMHEERDHEPVPHDWHNDEVVTSATASSSALPILLIVEDNADLRNHITEIVQQHYRVLQAVNGKEGFEIATQEIPDIIISDVMMPLMDGFTLAQKLKHDERTSHIPVILLTAKAGQAHKIEGLETGADDYLTKPFDHKELLTRVRNLINQRKLLRKKFAGDIILKPSEVSVNSADENFLNKVMQAIEANMGEEDFGVEELAKEVAMSRSQLHRKLIALTGQSPSEVLRNTRLLRAKELLQKKAATPSEVAYRVGFNSHTYFSKCFKEEFGISPSEVASG